MEKLNKEQLAAVLCVNGPLLILAGAGSGKTRVITNKIAYLIGEKNINPNAILALTFTNKAAAEIISRVRGLVNLMSERMWIGTFHSICLRLLRVNRSYLPESMRDFVIYGASEQAALIKECLKDLDVKKDLYPWYKVLSRISNIKNRYADNKKWPDNSGDFWIDEVISTVYRLYHERLLENTAMDFDDILINTVDLLKQNRNVADYYGSLFQFIMVDEYQDTNAIQYAFIKVLSSYNKNICVVGDDDQSIYKWRGADIGNILRFEKDYPSANVIVLEQNYRSTKNILAAADAVISKNIKRKDKVLKAVKESGDAVRYYRAIDEVEEARFICRNIKELISDKGMSYSDIAVFYRTNVQSRAIEEALINNTIPYQIAGGLMFYARREVKDILAYLNILINRSDSISLKRIINIPPRGIGKISLKKIDTIAKERNISFMDGIEAIIAENLLSATVTKKLTRFIKICTSLLADSEVLSPSAFINKVIELIEYEKYMQSMYDGDESKDRMENVYELISAAREYELTETRGTIFGFMDKISLLSDSDSIKDKRDIVTLMTLHTSKGLEFPAVFISGVENNLIPHKRALDKFENTDDIEEERRVFYVGMTRAMEYLFLISTAKRRIYGTTQYNSPSIFLQDIPQEYIDVGNKYRMPHSRSKHQNETENKAERSYTIGTKVIHPVWGIGIVKSTEGNNNAEMKLTISFQHFTKRIAAKYAKLTTLDN